MYHLDSITTKVAHISDLHFGMKNQGEVWAGVAGYLTKTVKPSLLLVTGDIVDSPRERFLKLAAESLSSLPCRYLVCPGNHDRHFFGNSLAFARISPAIGKFDYFFGDHIPGLDGLDVPLKDTNWKLRVVSADSSDESRHFARGYVSETRRKQLTSSFEGSDATLTMLLVHHHLLPVWGLERDLQPTRNLFNVVTMVNAGSVLEALAAAHVDLVLHGHEHFSNVAKYGSHERSKGEVTVVGAPSATGAHSFKGCNLREAGFLTLEIDRDDTVWLVRHKYCENQGEWGPADTDPLRLFTAERLRRSRFLRLGGPREAEAEASTVHAHFHFTAERDIIVTRTATNWQFQKQELSIRTVNDTGQPSQPEFWVRKKKDEPRVQLVTRGDAFRCLKDAAGVFVAYAEVPMGDGNKFADVLTRYKWIGGGRICESDIAIVAEHQRGEFYGENNEFVYVKAGRWLSLLEIDVLLPEGFTPQEEGVFACIKLPGDSHPRQSSDLTEQVRWDGRSHLSLSVKFPESEAAYYLCWKVPKGPQASQYADTFEQFCSLSEFNAARYLLDFLKDRSVDYITDVGIYAAKAERPSATFLNRSSVASNQRPSTAPTTVDLRHSQALATLAWYGKVAIGIESNDTLSDASKERGIELGERGVVMFPVAGPFDGPNTQPWGLVRLSWRNNWEDKLTEADFQHIYSIVQSASSAIIAQFFLARELHHGNLPN